MKEKGRNRKAGCALLTHVAPVTTGALSVTHTCSSGVQVTPGCLRVEAEPPKGVAAFWGGGVTEEEHI